MSIYIPNELPVIRNLDALLRCGICYEYMKTSMITSCSHNYCSLCIRKSLMYKSQCPACFEEAFESQLRNNRILDDIIEVFVIMSDEIKSFMQNCGKFSKSQNKTNMVADFLHNSNSLSNSRGKNNVISKGINHSVSSNRKDSKSACGSMYESAKVPSTSSYVWESEVGDVKLQDVASVKQTYQSPDHKRIVSKGDVLIPSIFSPQRKHNTTDNLVPCPVCSIDIPEKNINVHLDACLKRAEHSEQHSSPGKVQKRNPLPKLVYSLLQDKELRNKLRQQGLSTQGDRKALISRHQRFTLLYNSDSDALNPRSTADIIKQIEKEEHEEKKVRTSATTSTKLKIDRKMDPTLIEQAQQQYIQQNKTSFEKLIQSIREREEKNKTSVKQNLVISDKENESQDTAKEALVQSGAGLRAIKKSHIIISDEDNDDAKENEYGLNDPPSSMSPKNETNIGNMGGDMNSTSETTCDLNYEGDTDDNVSPILGKHTITDCSIKQNNKYYGKKPPQNLTPDMFENTRSLSLSCSKKCISSLQQSQQIERDTDSDASSRQSFSLLPEEGKETTLKRNQCNTASYINGTKWLNSQLDDPDFDPDSEDFDTEETPVIRRRNTRKSQQLSTSRGPSLRKRVKR